MIHVHSSSSVRGVDNSALVGWLDEFALDLVNFLVRWRLARVDVVLGSMKHGCRTQVVAKILCADVQLFHVLILGQGLVASTWHHAMSPNASTHGVSLAYVWILACASLVRPSAAAQRHSIHCWPPIRL